MTNSIYEQARNTDAFSKLSLKLSKYNFKLQNAYRFGELVFIELEGELCNNFKLIPPSNINDTWKMGILKCVTAMTPTMLKDFILNLNCYYSIINCLNEFDYSTLFDASERMNP